MNDGEVPIQGDARQVQDGRRRQRHVHRVVRLTQDKAENPATGEFVDQPRHHHREAKQEVGGSQRSQEQVTWSSQLPMTNHEKNDESVAGDRAER